jgi:trehalose 6-phosphate synthase/phosphatase
VGKWAQDFLERLDKMKDLKEKFLAKRINRSVFDSIAKVYKQARRRVLFLDYDGTLVGFQNEPQAAVPDEEVYDTLDKLARDPKNEIVLISGRDRDTFDKWFKNKHYTLIVEHGVWCKRKGMWETVEQLHDDWKPLIRPVLNLFVDRTPGTFIEEKNYSLVWHYRKADPELGTQTALELKDDLTALTAGHNLDVLEGNKVLEVKNSGVNKGIAAMRLVARNSYDFILAIGDDYTDEYLFEELPPEAVTIRVGLVNTYARYCVKSFSDVRGYLKALAAL